MPTYKCSYTHAQYLTHIHTYSLAHHLQATGLLFNIPEPPPTVKGAIERGPKPRRYKTQAGFLKQDVWLRPPSPQINNPQNLIFWRQGGSTRVTLFPHPVSWSSQGPGGVQPGSGAAVETWGLMPGRKEKERERKMEREKEKEEQQPTGTNKGRAKGGLVWPSGPSDQSTVTGDRVMINVLQVHMLAWLAENVATSHKSKKLKRQHYGVNNAWHIAVCCKWSS